MAKWLHLYTVTSVTRWINAFRRFFQLYTTDNKDLHSFLNLCFNNIWIFSFLFSRITVSQPSEKLNQRQTPFLFQMDVGGYWKPLTYNSFGHTSRDFLFFKKPVSISNTFLIFYKMKNDSVCIMYPLWEPRGGKKSQKSISWEALDRERVFVLHLRHRNNLIST